MMNFPDAPTPGAVFSQGGVAWRWDGEKWEGYATAGGGGGAGGASVSVGDAPPPNPKLGDLWWDSVSACLYLWYEDPSSSQWVPSVNQIVPPTAGGGTAYQIGPGLSLDITTDPDTLSLSVPVAIARGGTGQITAQLGLAALGGLALSGGTLTGPVTFSGPSSNLQLSDDGASKIEASVTLRVNMISQVDTQFGGRLMLAANPTQPLQAATKQYTDGFVPRTGTTMTGALLLSGDPTQALQAATKQYSDVRPIAFSYTGKPAAGARITVPLTYAIQVPANLTGTVVYASTAAAAPSLFVLYKTTPGTGSTELGRVTVQPSGAPTLSGGGGYCGPGDVLVMVAPTSQDGSLADVGITVPIVRA